MLSLTNIWRKSILFIQQYGFDFACYLIVLGLLFSRAILSISCFLLVFTAIIANGNKPLPRVKIYLLVFPIIYFFYLTSFWNTEDYSHYFRIIFKNLTLLIIPIAFWLNPKINSKKNIITLFFYGSLIILIITSFEVLTHYKASIEALKHSKNTLTIYTNFSSEFSVLSAIAFILFFDDTIKSKKSVIKIVAFSSLILFFVSLHLTALRFSLLLIYFFIFVYLIFHLINKKQFKSLILFIISITLLPILFYQFITSFKVKVDNTYRDMEVLIQNKNPNDYSISQRAVALRCATAVINKNIWFGVSPADAENAMQVEYRKRPYLLTLENRIFVHNQFFLFALSFGLPITLIIIGLLIYFSLTVIKENPILIYIILSFFIYWMIENGLEKQISLAAFLFFVFFLKQKSLDRNQKNSLS